MITVDLNFVHPLIMLIGFNLNFVNTLTEYTYVLLLNRDKYKIPKRYKEVLAALACSRIFHKLKLCRPKPSVKRLS